MAILDKPHLALSAIASMKIHSSSIQIDLAATGSPGPDEGPRQIACSECSEGQIAERQTDCNNKCKEKGYDSGVYSCYPTPGRDPEDVNNCTEKCKCSDDDSGVYNPPTTRTWGR